MICGGCEVLFLCKSGEALRTLAFGIYLEREKCQSFKSKLNKIVIFWHVIQ